MLDAAAVEKQLKESRRLLLVGCSELIAAGTVTTAMAAQVRDLNDVLTCLLDEAPDQRSNINYLIARCESIAARLAN